jgi:hypothetical protein
MKIHINCPINVRNINFYRGAREMTVSALGAATPWLLPVVTVGATWPLPTGPVVQAEPLLGLSSPPPHCGH